LAGGILLLCMCLSLAD